VWVEVVDGSAVVRDPTTGRLFVLNPTATLLWPLLDGSATPDELATEAAAAFGAPADEVRSDVERLVADLAALGLLMGD
jgi:PqqD family protein of HPr-rel-A system